eukprot:GSChrysophyteH1.ASY1.ANO1.837.1 assembled CDS
MEVSVNVWVKDESLGDWVPAVVSSKTVAEDSDNETYEITMKCEDDRELKALIKEGEDVDNVKLRNDASDRDVENLINLPYLHEPAIFDIYTYTGPILIATYYNVGLLKSQGIDNPTPLSPHIYAISDAAFRDMIAPVPNANQAILVSGESGAGKTESTKIVLKYLTTVGNSSGGTEVADGSIMDKVLQSNPILEAFGNAKTIRNDNSSRFGKYIDLNFNKRGHLVGGTIRTYLLEKVRLPTQQPGERNFHVFYQMAAGASDEDKADWKMTAMAGILHLGQIQFCEDDDGEGSRLTNDSLTEQSMRNACELLGIESDQLISTLTTPTRDALAKAIYGRIFDWIVTNINYCIHVDPTSVRADIGVLDIFGFECFKYNSFEQLLEYNKEKIEWNLIEHKTQGILAYLDDDASPKQKRDVQFCIQHYAGAVVYNVETFIEKNKDELPKEAVTLMQSSNVTLLSAIFIVDVTDLNDGTGPRRGSLIKDNVVKSVGSQFKGQLISLMEKIMQTKPHYIRCLKPNDENVPDNFNRVRTTEQLRYGGVLEAVRVARSGFPVRLTHSDFYARYRILSNPFHGMTKTLPRVLSVRKIAELALWTGKHTIPFQSVQLGLTKTFLRSDAHDMLESRRSRRLLIAVRIIQAFMKGRQARARVVRGFIARRRVRQIRYTKAAISIQSMCRMISARYSYNCLLYSVVMMQSLHRKWVARTLVEALLKQSRARHKFRCFRSAIISLQCKFKQKRAKEHLRRLRIQAKDRAREAEALAKEKIEEQLNRQREEEVKLMQIETARIEKEREKERLAAKEMQRELERVRNEMSTYAALAAQAENLKQPQAETDALYAEISMLKDLLTAERDHKAQVETDLVEALTLLSNEKRLRLDLEVKTSELNTKTAKVPSKLAEEKQTPRSGAASPAITDGSAASPGHANTWAEVPSPSDSINLANIAGLTAFDDPAPTAAHTSVTSVASIFDDSMEEEGGNSTKDVQSALTNERNIRQCLEDEVSRLRRINAELLAKTQAVTAASSANTTTSSRRGSGGAGASTSSSIDGVRPRSSEDGSSDALQKFYRALDTFHNKMIAGVMIHLWEGSDLNHKIEVKMALSSDCTYFFFAEPKMRRKSFIRDALANMFAPKIQLTNVRVEDMFECLPGGDGAVLDQLPEKDREYAEAALLTIVTKSEGPRPRTLLLLLPSREERNTMLSGLRMMQSAGTTMKALASPPPSGHALSGFYAGQSSTNKTPIGAVDTSPAGVPGKVVDMTSYGRVLSKNLTLTNELNDREAEIISLKKQETVFKETLKAKERMYEQDANVRMQLGRRLEQILLDKEEAKDEIDDLKAHVQKLELMIVDHAQERAQLEAENKHLAKLRNMPHPDDD